MTEEYEDVLCAQCNGSGEGQYDGTTCRKCRGRGVEIMSGDDSDAWKREREFWRDEK